MGQLKASEKLERLLAMIPWIMDNDGPKLETVAQRFEYPKELLLSDLTKVIFMVGHIRIHQILSSRFLLKMDVSGSIKQSGSKDR